MVTLDLGKYADVKCHFDEPRSNKNTVVYTNKYMSIIYNFFPPNTKFEAELKL
jgi:hypothetical protein